MAMTKTQLEGVISEIVEQVVGQKLTDLRQQNQIDIAKLVASNQQKTEQAQKSGLTYGRVVRALAIAKGDPYRASQLATKHWGEDDVATKALAAGDATAGGFLIGEELSSEIIELLRPRAAVRRLNPLTVPMETGSFSMSKITGGSTAGYAGENQNGSTTQPQTGMLKLSFKKMIALVPISNDMLRFGKSNSDTVIRDDLVSGMYQREDLAFIRGDGLQDTPVGLLNWCPAANKFNANVTVTLDNVTNDLGTAVLNLENANVRMIRPAWIMNPRSAMYLSTVRDGNGNYAFRDEMMRGTLWGFPFAKTTQIPKNLGGGVNESEIYLVDMADAVIGEATQLSVDASGEATYWDGSELQSTYSKDQTVIRAISEHDFGMRHDESISVIQAVTWAP